jgi:bifunctional non-homologous end joining protein LigD
MKTRPAKSAASDSLAQAGVQITHPDRLLYPAAGVTKGEIAGYYEAIADWMLPHLRDRPLTLKQCAPDVDHCRYMRHAGERLAPGVRTIEVQEQRKVGEYMIVDSLPALLTLVQRYIIEFHTWQATADHLEQPDRIVLDLDPGDEVPWPEVVAAARLVRDTVSALPLVSWIKTTGGKGLHIVVPFKPQHGWETCLAFARGVATRVMERDPSRYTINTAHRAARSRMILFDYLRNARTATAVAAYSARARANASVSVPMAWDELTTRLRPNQWTIRNVPARLARLRSDPWEDYWRSRQRLTAAVLKAAGVPLPE